MATVVWYDSPLGGHELDKVRENDYPRGAPWAHLAIPQSIQTKGKAKEKSHLRHENCTRSEPIAARVVVGNDQSFPYFVITFCRLRELRKLESSIWDKKGAAIKNSCSYQLLGASESALGSPALETHSWSWHPFQWCTLGKTLTKKGQFT